MKKVWVSIITMLLVLGSYGLAAAITLDFEGLQDQELINDFYNGGTGSMGSSGTDYGVTFSSAQAFIDADAGGTGNFGGEPSPSTTFTFISTPWTMNVAGGFDTSFSLYYSSPFASATLNIYDALNGTGNILGSILLSTTSQDTGDPNGAYSPFFEVNTAFSGTALSVGIVNIQGTTLAMGFDDITFSPANSGGVVPEPATMLLVGFGMIGLAGVTRRKIA